MHGQRSRHIVNDVAQNSPLSGGEGKAVSGEELTNERLLSRHERTGGHVEVVAVD